MAWKVGTHLEGGVEPCKGGQLDGKIAIGECGGPRRSGGGEEAVSCGTQEGLHLGEGGLHLVHTRPGVGRQVLQVPGDLGGGEEAVSQGQAVLQLAQAVAHVRGHNWPEVGAKNLRNWLQTGWLTFTLCKPSTTC